MKRASICGLVLVQALGGALAACGSGSEGAGQDTNSVSEVSLSLTSLPTGVQCIQVSVASGSTTLATQTFTAVANWTGTVGLGATFSKGTVTVGANAYNAACTAISGTTPTWIADSASLDVAPGKQNPVTLNFRQNYGVAATGNFAPTVVDFAVGTFSTGVVLADGTVKAWGLVGQPTGLSSVAELAVGYSHACARKTDGTVSCWGDNSHGELGNGVTSTTSTQAAVKVAGITGATGIAAGFLNSCATTAPYNSVSCWGFDSDFGDSGSGDVLTPVLAGNASFGERGVKMSMSQYDLCVVDTTSLRGICSGDNGFGQLATGDTGAVSGTTVSTANPLTSISVGYGHACGSDTTGHVYCWGYNGSGQLGLNTYTSALVDTLVPSLSGVTEVTAGYYFTCARTSAGAVYCWGDNGYGTVGDSTNQSRPAPTLISLPTASKKIRAAGYHVCSLQADDSLYCWGYNGYSELGDGTYITANKPQPVKL